MAHLLMSTTDTCLLWSQAVGAHNTKVSIVTAMSAAIRSEGSLLRSRDTTLLTPTGALTKTENSGVNKCANITTLSCFTNSEHDDSHSNSNSLDNCGLYLRILLLFERGS